jgi:hypothetical protein
LYRPVSRQRACFERVCSLLIRNGDAPVHEARPIEVVRCPSVMGGFNRLIVKPRVLSCIDDLDAPKAATPLEGSGYNCKGNQSNVTCIALRCGSIPGVEPILRIHGVRTAPPPLPLRSAIQLGVQRHTTVALHSSRFPSRPRPGPSSPRSRPEFTLHVGSLALKSHLTVNTGSPVLCVLLRAHNLRRSTPHARSLSVARRVQS